MWVRVLSYLVHTKEGLKVLAKETSENNYNVVTKSSSEVRV